MASKAACLVVLLLVNHATSFIIPEELPTILSVVYSNIPPIKKGTDSRVGVGFRLGEHADFQILVELGPQQETQPIGNDIDTKKKRAAMLTAAMKGEYGPWAQAIAKYQMEQKIKRFLEKYKTATAKPVPVESDQNAAADNQNSAGDWLTKWSQGQAETSDQSTAEQMSSRKRLPNINRMKVVNSQTNAGYQQDKSAQNDLITLNKLFGKNRNETESIA